MMFFLLLIELRKSTVSRSNKTKLVDRIAWGGVYGARGVKTKLVHPRKILRNGLLYRQVLYCMYVLYKNIYIMQQLVE